MSTWSDPARPMSASLTRDGLLEEPQQAAARRRRLYLALLAMVLMGLADLLCTLTYMRTSGMIEMNPLARAMIAIGDAPQLILFKAFTMVLCCGALYLARGHARGELCAWCCAAVMLLLTLHWVVYNQVVSSFTNDMVVLAMSGGEHEPRWVKLN